jgi:hypothetical protein
MAQIHDAKLGKKDGRRAQISSVGCKLLYEIHPRADMQRSQFNFKFRLAPVFLSKNSRLMLSKS